MQGASGGNSRPGVPTWARGLADNVFAETGPTGWTPGMEAGANYLSPGSIFPMIQQLLGTAQQGGAVQRDLASQLTGNAVTAGGNIANQSAQAAGQVGQLNSMVPGMLDAAQQFAGNVNQAENQGFNPAMGAANQTLQNVMNPTYYNPLFQNAAASLTPQVNAAFSSRGLGSSGMATAELGSQYSNLANQFAQRQVQEQMAAQQGLGNLASAFGNQGIAAAQLPGQIYGQFMQGAGAGQQALGQAGQNQLMPLQASGMGAEQYWQGIQNPLSIYGNAYSVGADPMKNAMTGVTGVMGGIATPTQGLMSKILGK